MNSYYTLRGFMALWFISYKDADETNFTGMYCYGMYKINGDLVTENESQSLEVAFQKDVSPQIYIKAKFLDSEQVYLFKIM